MPSLKKNFAYQGLYQLLLLLAPLVTAPYVSRTLGPEGVGLNTWTSSIAQTFVLIAMLGIADHGARVVARVRGQRDLLDQAFSELYSLHAATSLVALALYAAYIALFAREHAALLAVQGLWIVAALLDTTWLFAGIEQFGAVAARNSIVKIATVAGIFTLVRSDGDVWIYAAILAGGTLAGHLSVLPFVRRHVSFRRPSWHRILGHSVPLAVMFLPAVAVSAFRVANRIMLGSMASAADVGFFSTAERLMAIPTGLIWAFAGVMLPRVAGLVTAGDEVRARRLNAVSFRYIWMMSLGLAFGLAGVAPVLAPTFFGREFAEVGVITSVLSISVPLVAFASVIRSQFLIPRSMDRRFIAALFSGVPVSLAANMLLIPRLGALGAAIALVITELTVCIAQTIAARRVMPVASSARSGLFFLFAGAGMYGIVTLIGSVMGVRIYTLLIQTLVGGVIYAGASAVYLARVKDSVFMNAVGRGTRWIRARCN